MARSRGRDAVGHVGAVGAVKVAVRKLELLLLRYGPSSFKIIILSSLSSRYDALKERQLCSSRKWSRRWMIGGCRAT